MKWKILLVMCLFVIVGSADAGYIGGDGFCLHIPIFNDSPCTSSYECYLLIEPDSEGFNVSVEPTSFTLEVGEEQEVMIDIESSLAIS